MFWPENQPKTSEFNRCDSMKKDNDMISNEIIKKVAFGLGAQLCGIAPIERFSGAPSGFHPNNIFSETKSVIVLAKLFPEGAFQANSLVPYTATNDVLLNEVIQITCNLCNALERNDGLTAVPIPSEPYEYWDDEKKEGKGILSLKHAGYLAGLGSIGRNSLLANQEYGNRLVLGAALLNIPFEGDMITDHDFCDDNCNLCIDGCSVHAINGGVVNQKLCRSNSMNLTKKGYMLYICNECRSVCPNGSGVIKRSES